MSLHVMIPAVRRAARPAALALVAAGVLAACNGPRVVQEEPVLVTGDRVPLPDQRIADAATREAESAGARLAARDAVTEAALRDCAPALCAAVGRGELALGMTEAQVLAATRSTADAWSIRRSGAGTFMSPRHLDATPRDAQGPVVLVQLDGRGVTSVTRRDRTGLVVEASPADTTRDARVTALADALIREGDDFVAAGDRARALERYDRALILRENDAMLNYKVATLLDQQLRPVEALMRYQRFLLSLELQRIDAVGTQNAKLAEAIALAQQRIVVLERSAR